MPDKIVIVDDEVHLLKACQRMFRGGALECVTFTSPVAALDQISSIRPAVVVSDQRMPEMTGTEFLEKTKQRFPSAVRIIMSGYADIDTAIDAINRGRVFRFIKKPWDGSQFRLEIRRAVDYHHMTQKLYSLTSQDPGGGNTSERFRGVLEMAGAVCHEFSQPLQVISGYCDLLMTASEQCTRESLAAIKTQSDRLSYLLDCIMSIRTYKTREYLNGRIVDLYHSGIGDGQRGGPGRHSGPGKPS